MMPGWKYASSWSTVNTPQFLVMKNVDVLYEIIFFQSAQLRGMKVTLEFSGGAELLVGKTKKHNVELPEKNEWTLEGLLAWVGCFYLFFSFLEPLSPFPHKVRDNLLQDRPELFMKDNTVNQNFFTSGTHVYCKHRCALEFWC